MKNRTIYVKNIPSILHCKSCKQISSKIDFEESPRPKGIGKFITIYTESTTERLTDETRNLKKCPDCFSYYYFYFHEDLEDTIEPIVRHFMERVNFTKLHSIFDEILNHKKSEKNIFKYNYPRIIDEYISKLKEHPKLISENIMDHIVGSAIDYYILNDNWHDLENVLLRNKNPEVIYKAIKDLVLLYGERFRGSLLNTVCTYYRAIPDPVNKKNREFLKKNFKNYGENILVAYKDADKNGRQRLLKIIDSASSYKIRIKKLLSDLVPYLSDVETGSELTELLVLKDVDILKSLDSINNLLKNRYKKVRDNTLFIIENFLEKDHVRIQKIKLKASKLKKEDPENYEALLEITENYFEKLKKEKPEKLSPSRNRIQKHKKSVPKNITLATPPDKSTVKLLREAAFASNVSTLKLLLKKGFSQNYVFKEVPKISFIALEENDLELLELSLKNGHSNINASENMYGPGDTLLARAVKKNNIEAVKMLLNYGIKINDDNGEKKTILIWASETGKIDRMKILIKYGADVNARDSYGRTVLIYATEMGKSRAVQLLIEKGADVNKKDQSKITPLIIASRKGYTDIIRILLENDTLPNQKDYDQSPLTYAVENKHIKIAKLLIDFGADVNLVDSSACRYTALMHAVMKNSLEIVKLLLKHGARTNMRASKGWVYRRNALMLAVQTGNIEIVKLLINKMIERKERIDEVDSEGKTVFNLTRNKNIIELLNDTLNRVPPKTKRESKFLQLVKKAGLYTSEGNKYIPRLVGLLNDMGFREKDVQALKEFIINKRMLKNILNEQLKALKTEAKNDSLDSLIWISQNTDFKTETEDAFKRKIKDFVKYTIHELKSGECDTCKKYKKNKSRMVPARELSLPPEGLEDIIILKHGEDIKSAYKNALRRGIADSIKTCAACGGLFVYEFFPVVLNYFDPVDYDYEDSVEMVRIMAVRTDELMKHIIDKMYGTTTACGRIEIYKNRILLILGI